MSNTEQKPDSFRKCIMDQKGNALCCGCDNCKYEEPLLNCDVCKMTKADVVNRIDPYQQEIQGMEVKRNLCDDCYQNLLGDI